MSDSIKTEPDENKPKVSTTEHETETPGVRSLKNSLLDFNDIEAEKGKLNSALWKRQHIRVHTILQMQAIFISEHKFKNPHEITIFRLSHYLSATKHSKFPLSRSDFYGKTKPNSRFTYLYVNRSPQNCSGALTRPMWLNGMVCTFSLIHTNRSSSPTNLPVRLCVCWILFRWCVWLAFHIQIYIEHRPMFVLHPPTDSK